MTSNPHFEAQTLGVARDAVTRPGERVPLVETMFASALATHPSCRLVVLSDQQSVFNFTGPLAKDVRVYTPPCGFSTHETTVRSPHV